MRLATHSGFHPNCITTKRRSEQAVLLACGLTSFFWLLRPEPTWDMISTCDPDSGNLWGGYANS